MAHWYISIQSALWHTYTPPYSQHCVTLIHSIQSALWHTDTSPYSQHCGTLIHLHTVSTVSHWYTPYSQHCGTLIRLPTVSTVAHLYTSIQSALCHTDTLHTVWTVAHWYTPYSLYIILISWLPTPVANHFILATYIHLHSRRDLNPGSKRQNASFSHRMSSLHNWFNNIYDLRNAKALAWQQYCRHRSRDVSRC